LFIPHELELVQAVQVGENLLGVAQVVGEDVVVVPHTLSQEKFIVLSLMSLSSSRQSRGGKPSWRWPGSREKYHGCAAHPVTRKIYCFIPHELELVQAVQVGEDLLGVAHVVGEYMS
jgi:hypothetical protein